MTQAVVRVGSKIGFKELRLEPKFLIRGLMSFDLEKPKYAISPKNFGELLRRTKIIEFITCNQDKFALLIWHKLKLKNLRALKAYQ